MYQLQRFLVYSKNALMKSLKALIILSDVKMVNTEVFSYPDAKGVQCPAIIALFIDFFLVLTASYYRSYHF